MKIDKSKKVVSLALAGMSVAGVVAPVVAQADTVEAEKVEAISVDILKDAIKETKTEEVKEVKVVELSESAKKLHSLGIIVGKEDGKMHEEANVTRAEFTKIILGAIGIENSEMMKNVGVFEDVPATAWHSGYINMAQSLGLVSGVGENKFAPEREITHEEALTMIVNALGYKDLVNAQAKWPIGHTMKATELGLLKNIKVENSKAPATRGDIFRYIDNALDVKVMENFGGVMRLSEQTLLEKKLDMVSIKVEVLEVGTLLDSRLNTNEIKVKGKFNKDDRDEETRTLKLKTDAVNPLDLLHRDVHIIIDKDDNVNFVKEVRNSGLKTDKVKSIKYDEIELEGSKSNYRVDKDTEIIIDYREADKSDLSDIKENAKIVYETKGKTITRLVATNYNKPLIVEEVKKDEIVFNNSSNIDADDFDEVVVYLNGKVGKVADLKETDVAYSYDDGDKLILEVYRKTAKGKITRIDSNDKTEYIYFEGKKVNVDRELLTSIDKGKKFTEKFDRNLLDTEVTVSYNAHDEIVLIVGDTKASQGNFFVVERVMEDVVEKGDFASWVKLVDSNGKSKNYKLANRVKVDRISKNDFVAVEFDKDEITSIEKVTSSKAELGEYRATTLRDVDLSDNKLVNVDRLRLTVDGKNYTLENKDIPIFFIEDGDITVGKVRDLDDAKGKADLILLSEDREVGFIFVENTSKDFEISGDTKNAVVLESYRASKDGDRGLFFTLSNGKTHFVENETTSRAFVQRGYGEVSSDIRDIEEGDIITYSLDGKDRIRKLQEMDLTHDFDLHSNIVEDTKNNSIKINGKWYSSADEMSIADVRNKDRVKSLKDFRDISRGSRVVFGTDRHGDITGLSVISNERDTKYKDTLVFENKATDLVFEAERVVRNLEGATVTDSQLISVKTDLVKAKEMVEKVETKRVRQDLSAKVTGLEARVKVMADALTQKQLVATVEAKMADLDKVVTSLNADTTLEKVAELEKTVKEIELDIAKLDEVAKKVATEKIEKAKAILVQFRTNLEVIEKETPKEDEKVVVPEADETKKVETETKEEVKTDAKEEVKTEVVPEEKKIA